MGLTERISFRTSRWEMQQYEKHRIDISKVCRDALMKKIREIVTDPDVIIDAGENGPAAFYVNAWQRLLPVLSSMLEKEDYILLKASEEKLQDLKRILNWSLLKPVEIQQMGIFLQGGEISDRILSACIEANL